MSSNSSSAQQQRVASLIQPMTTKVVMGEVPQPAVGQVRVKLEGCGICASNLAVWEGRPWFEYPRAAGSPGHEGWGTVDCVGAGVDDIDIGERVAIISGNAYAEYDVAARNAVVRIPSQLAGQPFPGEPLGCVMNIFERSDIQRDQTVAIIGAGFLGLLLTQLCAKAGARVVALSRRAYALTLAARMGARNTVRTDAADGGLDLARKSVDGGGYDRVIEAVGEQSTLDLASALVAERGRLIIAGYHQDGPRQVDMQQWNWRGIDVINAHERSIERYAAGVERAITAVLEERMNPFPLLTHTVSLEALDHGFQLTRSRPDGFMKAMLRIDARS
jgi:threonine dehydrogenase-like Zn-dependent dehydrogenase